MKVLIKHGSTESRAYRTWSDLKRAQAQINRTRSSFNYLDCGRHALWITAKPVLSYEELIDKYQPTFNVAEGEI